MLPSLHALDTATLKRPREEFEPEKFAFVWNEKESDEENKARML